MKAKLVGMVCLALFLLVLAVEVRAGQTLNTLTVEGQPFLSFNIADAGETFGMDKFGTTGQISLWTLNAAELGSLTYASNYWAALLGSMPTSNCYVPVSVGTYAGSNADAISLPTAGGPLQGYSEVVAGLLGSFADDSALGQLRMGYTLGQPHLDYTGPLEALPHNGPPNHLATIWTHEIGHLMGISADTGNDGSGQSKFQDSFSAFTDHLLDANGNPAQPGQFINKNNEAGFFVLPEGQYAFFQGPHVLQVLDGAIIGDTATNPNRIEGVPVNGWEGGSPELSHIEMLHSMMSHQSYINFCTFMEADLAVLQDIGLQIDRKNFFGYSLYRDNEVLNNSQGFFARNASGTDYLPGQYNTAPMGVGLHIYGSGNTVYQQADILSSGFGAAGIRIDGENGNNNLIIDPGIKVHAQGQLATGLLVSYGSQHSITQRGELAAQHPSGVGARFDFGDNMNGNEEFEYRGSYIWVAQNQIKDPRPELAAPLVSRFDVTGPIYGGRAAILISENAYVQQINIMRGRDDYYLVGDIISNWNPNHPMVRYSGSPSDLLTQLTFGQMADSNGQVIADSQDPDFYMLYQGNITGPHSLDVQVMGGTLAYLGTMDTYAFTLAAGSQLEAVLGANGSYINAQHIALAAGAQVGVSSYAFSYGPLLPGKYALLTLNPSASFVNHSQVRDSSGSFAMGPYDYRYHSPAWHDLYTLTVETHATFNHSRGGTAAVNAPLAIAAYAPHNQLLANRMGVKFKSANKEANQGAQLAAAFMGLAGQHSGLAAEQEPALLAAHLPQPDNYSPSSSQPQWIAGANGGGDLRYGSSSLWMTPTFTFTDSKAGPGYNLKGPAWAAGFDQWLTDNIFVGVAVAGALPRYESADAKVDAKNFNSAMYAGVGLPYELELGLFLAYGHTNYKQMRNVAGQYYSSDYSSNTLSAGLNIARSFALQPALSLRPFLAYEFINLEVQDYDESAGPLALNLASQRQNLHLIRAGAELTYSAESAYVAGRVFYAGMSGDTSAQSQIFFSHDPAKNSFDSQTTALDNNALGLGVSAGLPMGDALEFYVTYNLLLGANTTSHQASFGLQLKF